MSRFALWLFGPTKRELMFGLHQQLTHIGESQESQRKSNEDQNQILQKWMREKIKEWDARISALERDG